MRLFGISFSPSAPVLERTLFSSIGIVFPGNGDGSDPVAIIMFFALISLLPPPIRFTEIS
jgi:hypothetical protein